MSTPHQRKEHHPVAPSFIIGLILLLAVAGCSTQRYAGVPLVLDMDSPDFTPRSGPPENMILRTLGEPGQGFEGTLLLDGVAQSISGITPFERSYSAKALIGDVAKREQSGTLSFEISTESGIYRAGTLKYKGSRCRFGYHNRTIQVRSMN